ncbi:hypothetical protein P3S68_029980 [Capsicum galapagoense]
MEWKRERERVTKREKRSGEGNGVLSFPANLSPELIILIIFTHHRFKITTASKFPKISLLIHSFLRQCHWENVKVYRESQELTVSGRFQAISVISLWDLVHY